MVILLMVCKYFLVLFCILSDYLVLIGFNNLLNRFYFYKDVNFWGLVLVKWCILGY